MPGTKRTTKSVSYTERDDDDDFISKIDNTKKTSNTKPSSTRQPPRKRNEKLSIAEQEELALALQLSKETSVEIENNSDDKESTTSQSTVSSYESKTTEEKDNDEHDENLLPKSKRMKREEEEEEDDDDDDENESNSEEEEEEPTPRKQAIRKTEEPKKNSEIPTVTSIDLNSSRLITRGQQKSSIPQSESSTKKSDVPLGFPTSKIIIPSLQTSRVGLSRKSSAIKSLHPNLNQRIVHE